MTLGCSRIARIGKQIMKSGYLFGVAFIAMALASGHSNAADIDDAPDGMEFYVSVFAGASFANNVKTDYAAIGPYSLDLKTGYLLGGTVGMNVTNMIRGEVELSHSHWSAEKASFDFAGGSSTYSASGDVSATYLLANAWIDIENDSSFTPYIGGGLGYGWADAKTTFDGSPFGYGDGEGGFAFQLGAGVKFDLTESASIDLGYRFKSIQNIDFKDSDGNGVYENGDVISHNIQIGLTYNF
jgi:opacity protein-like surface antigen